MSLQARLSTHRVTNIANGLKLLDLNILEPDIISMILQSDNSFPRYIVPVLPDTREFTA
jgi:hypothetical protein